MFSKKDFTNVEGIMMLHAVKMHSSKRNASKYLNVSLDTLDKYIGILEEELGAKLVTANGRGCQLTVHGEKVVKETEPIKSCIQSIYAVTSTESDAKGEVLIAYDQSVRWNLYARNVRKLFLDYPNITLNVDTFNGTPDMSNVQYDISLSYEIPKGEDLVIIRSKEIPCKFFAASEYLQKNPYPQNIDELLRDHRLIVKKGSLESGKAESRLLQKALHGVCLTNSAFVVNDLVVHGGGVGIMPVYFANSGQGLVCLDNLECDVMVTMYLISHKTRKDIPKVRAVLDYYKNMMQSL